MPQQLITESAKATAEALIDPLISQSTSIILPMYDWDAYLSSSLFQQMVDNWVFLNQVKKDSEDHL